jgi:hypothetical protein
MIKQKSQEIRHDILRLRVGESYAIVTEHPGISPNNEPMNMDEFRHQSGYRYVGTFVEIGSNTRNSDQNTLNQNTLSHIQLADDRGQTLWQRVTRCDLFSRIETSITKVYCLSFVVTVNNEPITMWFDISLKNMAIYELSDFTATDAPLNNAIYDSNIIWNEPRDQLMHEMSKVDELCRSLSKKIKTKVASEIHKMQVGENYLIFSLNPGWLCDDHDNHTRLNFEPFLHPPGYRYVGTFTGFGYHQPDYTTSDPMAPFVYVSLTKDDVQANLTFCGNYLMTFTVMVNGNPMHMFLDISSFNRVTIYPMVAVSITEKTLASLGPKLNNNPYIIPNFVKPFLNTTARKGGDTTLGRVATGESDDLTPKEHRSSQSMIRLRQDLTLGRVATGESDRSLNDLTNEIKTKKKRKNTRRKSRRKNTRRK